MAKHALWNNLLYHFKTHSLLVDGTLGNYKELIISLKPPKEYIPERGCFDDQVNTSMDRLSMDLGYVTDLNKEKYHELLNDATISRISDFGYSNDAEVIEHYHKTKNYLRNRPLKVPTESIRNKFDIGANKFMPNQMPIQNNVAIHAAIRVDNRNKELIDIIRSLGLTLNQNESEKKFVRETRF